MKIIGETEDGFILQAGNSEVYKLIGFNSSYSGERKKKIKVGDDLQVAAMFSQLYGLVHATGCIDDLKEKAQSIIDELTQHPAVPILEGTKAGPDNA